MSPFFSIIIPVYNVEKYLKDCVESIIRQEFIEYEIILVDDGSNDGSGKICDYYSSIDDRIITIHKENGGLSDARNAALKIAKGRFIIFVDSDDRISPKSLDEIFHQLNNEPVDMLRVQCIYFYDGKRKKKPYHRTNKSDVQSGPEYLEYALKNDYLTTVWAYVYSRDFLISNDLHFVEKIFHEDEEFMPRCILKAQTIMTSDCVFYEYRIRKGSTMTKKNQTKNAHDLLFIVDSLSNIYGEIDNDKLKVLLFDRLVSLELTALILGKFFHKDDMHLIDLSFIKKHAYSKFNKIKAKLCAVSFRLFYILEIIHLSIRKKL